MKLLDRIEWFGSACSVDVCSFIESFWTRQPQHSTVILNHFGMSSLLTIKRHPCFWRHASMRITLTRISDADLSAKTYATILES